MRVATVINVDVCPFLAFLGLTCHLEDMGISVGCTKLPDSKDTKLGKSDQEAFPSAAENTRVVVLLCLSMEVHPYSYFLWYGYF